MYRSGVMALCGCALAVAGGVHLWPTRHTRSRAGPDGGSAAVVPGLPDHRPSASAPGPPGDARLSTVVRVVDGDTIVLRPGPGGRVERVRLIGVNAPEVFGRRDCFGVEAARALRRLAPPGSPVRVAGDREAHDRYGRRLLYLWTPDGRFVDAALVRAGFARALIVPPDTRFAAVFAAAEDAARWSRAGLWAACS